MSTVPKTKKKPMKSSAITKDISKDKSANAQKTNQPSYPNYFPTIMENLVCPCDGGCPKCKNGIEQLKPGQSNNVYEQEAQKITKNVTHNQYKRNTRVNVNNASRSSNLNVHFLNDNFRSPNFIPGSGQRLPKRMREEYGSIFNYNFNQTRIHINSLAAQAAERLNARAYTINNNIIFGSGEYAPVSPKGQNLLVHELTHIVQQNNSPNLLNRAEKNIKEEPISFRSLAVKTLSEFAPDLSNINPNAELPKFIPKSVRTTLKFFMGVVSSLNLKKEEIGEIYLKLIEFAVKKKSNSFFSGMIQGVKDTFNNYVELFENFSENFDNMMGLITELIPKLMSPEVEEFAFRFGLSVGNHYSEKFRELIGLSFDQFSFEIGKVVGPILLETIIGIALSFVGLPILSGAKIIVKIAADIIFEKFPKLTKKIRITLKLKRKLPKIPDEAVSDIARITKSIDETGKMPSRYAKAMYRRGKRKWGAGRRDWAGGQQWGKKGDDVIYKGKTIKPVGKWIELDVGDIRIQKTKPTDSIILKGAPGRGQQRIVIDEAGNTWFTPDHYETWIPIRTSGNIKIHDF
jgi:hypothetical protein